MIVMPTPPSAPRLPDAFLPSAGFGERRATLHSFVRFEPVQVGGQHAMSVIYACSETGAERRWVLW